MRRYLWPLVLVLAGAVGCAGGGGGGASVTSPTSVVGPPAGASVWLFAYRAASTHTCPAPPQTPDDGGPVTLTLAGDGRTLGLVGLVPTAITIPSVAVDGGGNWTATRPGIPPGSVVTIRFRFTTSTRADGTMVADRAIFTGGEPCSATWPISLDRVS